MSLGLPLLPSYQARTRTLTPTVGLVLPPALLAELARNDLVNRETVQNGNCGLHAVAVGIIDAAKRNKALAATAKYKALSKVSKEANLLCNLLREEAVKWMSKNEGCVMWDGMTYCEIAFLRPPANILFNWIAFVAFHGDPQANIWHCAI